MAGDGAFLTLGDVVTLQRGTTYKGALLGQPGPVLLGLASIQRNGGFRDDNLKTYGGDSPEKLTLRPGDIYVSLKDVTQSADLLGSIARVPTHISAGRVTQDTVKLTFIRKDVPSRFIYWLLRTPAYREYCRAHAIGTTNLSIARDDFLAFPVPQPKERELTLVETLEALDDKIELNRRMNATLEAMVRALFQSWFVDFDPVRAKLDGRQPVGLDEATAALFPAHFDHKTEGVVPTGWRATTLGEVIEISDSKRIPLSGCEREARQGTYPYHGAASVMDYVDDYLFDGIYALMGEDGSVINDDGTPVLQYVWGKFWVNNHAHVLRGKNGISTEHLLLHLKGCNIAPFVNGAVQPKLNQGNMNRIPFMLPSPEIGQAFAKTIEPLFAQIRANTDQSRTLATLRDTLLPKLLSGELQTTSPS